MKYLTVAYGGKPDLKKQETFIRVIERFNGGFCGSGFALMQERQDLAAKFATLPRDQEKKLCAKLKMLGFDDIEVQSSSVDNWPTRQSFA